MNSLLATKLIWGLLSIGSMVGVVGTIMNDRDINSTKFMKDDEVQMQRSFSDYDGERDVASLNQGEGFTIPRIVLNNKNMKSIDGVWEITRITNDRDVVVYDTYRPSDRKTIINLPITLTGTSEVRIDKDEDLKFYILFLHETKKTISLIRPYGKGYEIVEAKRNKIAGKINPYGATGDKKSLGKFNDSIASLDKKIEKEDEIHNMSLDKVIFPNKTSLVLNGDKVSGSVSVKSGVMDDLEFNLVFKNLKGKQEDISVSQSTVKIMPGGMFKFEHDNTMVNGIITKNGKSGYRIRFVTGSLQGASLNFVTENEAIRIRDLKDQMPYDYENIGQPRDQQPPLPVVATQSEEEFEDEEEEDEEAYEQDEASVQRKVSQVEIQGGEYTDRNDTAEYNETEREIEEEEHREENGFNDSSANIEVEKSGFNFSV